MSTDRRGQVLASQALIDDKSLPAYKAATKQWRGFAVTTGAVGS
jgi:hypothetical protein